jgi:hypothetical protein
MKRTKIVKYVLRVLCLFLVVESALKVSRSNSDTPCRYLKLKNSKSKKNIKFLYDQGSGNRILNCVVFKDPLSTFRKET